MADSKLGVLMVCLGNICRSPLAQGILEKYVDSEKVYVDSAGTGDWHVGEEPDKRSIEVALRNGIDIQNQRGRHFSIEDFKKFDYIYVMDRSNLNNLSKISPHSESLKNVDLILNVIFPGEDREVPDPYYGQNLGFEKVYSLLDEACQKIAKKIN